MFIRHFLSAHGAGYVLVIILVHPTNHFQFVTSISSLIIWFVAPIRPETCKHQCCTGLLAPLQTTHSAHLCSPKVHRSDGILLWLISSLIFNVGICVFYFVVSSPIFSSSTFSCLLPWLPFLVSFVVCFSNWGFSWELLTLSHVEFLVTYVVWVCTPWLGLVFFSCQWDHFCCYWFPEVLDTYFEFPEGGPSTWSLGGFYVLDFQQVSGELEMLAVQAVRSLSLSLFVLRYRSEHENAFNCSCLYVACCVKRGLFFFLANLGCRCSPLAGRLHPSSFPKI